MRNLSLSLPFICASLVLAAGLPAAHASLPGPAESRLGPLVLAEFMVLNRPAPPPEELPTCASLRQDMLELRLEVVNEVYLPTRPETNQFRRRALTVPLSHLVYVLEDAGAGDRVADVAIRSANLIDHMRGRCG